MVRLTATAGRDGSASARVVSSANWMKVEEEHWFGSFLTKILNSKGLMSFLLYWHFSEVYIYGNFDDCEDSEVPPSPPPLNPPLPLSLCIIIFFIYTFQV